jgi:hypothetical protein
MQWMFVFLGLKDFFFDETMGTARVTRLGDFSRIG